MCGFLGYLGTNPISSFHMLEVAAGLELLDHRGPDDTVLTQVGEHTAVGFKRLAIVDQVGSRQPLSYPSTGPEAGRWTLVFNGEIYNHVALRQELQLRHGAEFITDGDAEVVASAYHYWGAAALRRLRGMFAFVLWDSLTETVHAVRDPFGIKPLYYRRTDDGLWLSSEMRPLRAVCDGSAVAGASAPTALDQDALSLYLTMQYVPEPYPLRPDIRSLQPGRILTCQRGGEPAIERYVRPMLAPAATAAPDDLAAEIRGVLRDSVRAHMRADVPVGAFLSSGIDSTSIVALAREVNPAIRVFSAGFDLPGYSEIEIAQATADHLGVSMVPTVVTPSDVMEALPTIVWHLDDPIADPSLVPLYFLARTASNYVKVVLSGEGADELFGGYRIYREPAALAPVQRLPQAIQRGLGAISALLPAGVRGKSYLERATTPIEARYYGNARIFNDQEKRRLMRAASDISPADVTAPLYLEAAGLDDVSTMQHIDINTWLAGDILTKADRMSMAHSIELRVPYLDQNVFEVAARVPTALKLPPGSRTTKYALRLALRGVVPPFIVDRPKLGFPTPTAAWLRGELGGWAHDVLASSGTRHLLDLDYAHALLVEHQQRQADHARKLWAVLTFCIWHAVVVEGSLQPMIPAKRLIAPTVARAEGTA